MKTMPLSEPVRRRHLHTRTIVIEGFARDDGLWDIEGRMTDVKTYEFPNQDRGRIEAGEPLHDMRVRLTIDSDMRVHAVEASTEASPFRICPDIAPSYRQLEGAVIGPGWRARIREVAGGREGCTHISELLMAMATPAFQTLYAKREGRDADTPPQRSGKRPHWVDSCYALRDDGELIRQRWPQYARPKS
jgi:hypothetical protein